MSRLANAFKNNKKFVGYLTAGDGGIAYSLACAAAMIEGGVDILEIGLPFSDPVADGPVIERAHKRALEAGTTADDILEFARRLRKVTDIPLILFSYYNPLLQKGTRYLRQLREVGFDAVLVVDLPAPDLFEAEPFFKGLLEAELLPILLATPSTQESRLAHVGNMARGFLYYASQKGTTGVRSKLADDFSAQIARIRPHTHVPIVAGFGIADRTTAEAALQCADGFVVGSAFVKLLEQKADSQELQRLAQAIDPRQQENKK